MNLTKESLRLYAVTDRSWLGGAGLETQVEAALRGGATFIQLREKDLPAADFLREAVILRGLCARYRVPFVINDNVEIARQSHADGVHVGQSDMAAARARDILGPDKIIGVSATTVAEALLAEKQGADYLGVGAVFPTASKADAAAVPLPVLRDICQAVSIPVIAIGGISPENVSQLAGTGIVGIAVISAIFAQRDITAATRDLAARTAIFAGGVL